jgi:DNA-binding NtrC family response regulator
MRILVVDDEPDLLTVATAGLEIAGFDVLSSSDGHEASALLKSNEVDVLFTDVVMPGMSGLELAHQARRHHPTVRVILTSGYVPLEANLPGDMQFVPKPYQFADLIAAIRRAN